VFRARGGVEHDPSVSLTLVKGPLSEEPAGELSVDLESRDHLFYLEPMPYRVRALFEGETVVDSFEPLLLHETGALPVYYFRSDDVRRDLLRRSERALEDDKGTGERWDLVGERTEKDAAWSYTEPVVEAAHLRDLLAFEWDVIDEWFCEDEQMFGHPRDPYSRIDAYRTTRHIRVSLDGVLLADTRRATVLYETNLPPRYYIPAEDVRGELLVPSPHRTRCAYKGSASYWSVQLPDRVEEDVVWTYADPQHDGEPVRDLLCFFNERVDLEVDGELVERET
jgi:uncharacterized protein (DUF427 family)